MKTPHIGSRFDDFLESEELLTEVQAEAIRHVDVWEIRERLDDTGTKDSTGRLGISRSQ